MGVAIVILSGGNESSTTLLKATMEVRVRRMSVPTLMRPIYKREQVLFLFFTSYYRFEFLLSVHVYGDKLLTRPALLSRATGVL